MTMESRLRRLQRAVDALQTQVDALMETNARLRQAYRDLEAALRIADECRERRYGFLIDANNHPILDEHGKLQWRYTHHGPGVILKAERDHGRMRWRKYRTDGTAID